MTDIRTENEAAFDFAEANLADDTIDLSPDLKLVRRREGEEWEAHDLTPTLPAPRRSTGTIRVYDATSFADAVSERSHDLLGEPVIYFNEESHGLVAVLNDDHAGAPGWRDYRVELNLRRTPDWDAWLKGQGLGDQLRFAERIEDGEPEIIDPAAAVMLELAQTFHAVGSVKFRGGTRLQSGARQYQWDETIEASGGVEPGTIAVPETFRIGVRPFIASEKYEVTARVRFRLTAGDLKIGYDLVRPEAVERDAFMAVVDGAREQLADATFIAGPSPAAR